MLTRYPAAPGERESATEDNSTWVDLLNPTDEEIASVQARFGLKLPSREELSEIEFSSRISEKNGLLVLSMPSSQMLTTWKKTHLHSDLSWPMVSLLRFATRSCGRLRTSRSNFLNENSRSQAAIYFQPWWKKWFM